MASSNKNNIYSSNNSADREASIPGFSRNSDGSIFDQRTLPQTNSLTYPLPLINNTQNSTSFVRPSLGVLQWNLNGFFNNYHELQLLINDIKPCIISLQETHIKHNSQPHCPKQYSSCFYNLTSNTSCKQGVSLLVHKSVPHNFIQINSNIAAVGVQIELKIKFTVISIYIPPEQSFSRNDLDSILKDINTPVILTGDFNSWSPSWGSSTCNTRGKIIEHFITNSGLAILNDGRPTHFSTQKTYTHVDLTLVTPSLIPNSTWAVSEHLHGSDHFPITTTISLGNNLTPIRLQKRFLLDRADWELFQSTLSTEISQRKPSSNINHEAALIQKSIRSAANIAIPQSKDKTQKK